MGLVAALLPALPTLIVRLIAGVSAARQATANEIIASRQARRDERIARKQARRDVLVAEQGHFLTRMMRPVFAFPLAAYYAAVIADSLYFHSQSVQKLPEPIGEWSGWIISALFLADAGERITRTIVRRS